ncbi:MAG TPA: Gfo/Idh/MocA family oxidoreductase [Opitutaceae bacterium]|jgi:predicted dehydrogenase|nr:Gfo/Idh/MocA family oxidoreductase [Opitutaceae bacterium]
MQKLRTAIVGSGKVAHLHAKALKALGESELVGVCGRPSATLDAFGATYGIRVFHDIKAMARDAGVQAVVVGTPHPVHAAAAVDAAEAGVHVLVEKPLASTLADCDRMIAAARRSGVALGTISQRRFYPPCQRIRAAIDSGKVGKPVLASAVIFGWRDEAYYRSDPWRGKWKEEGGGILVNQAPHQLDLLLWYMGEIDQVQGYWANLNHPYIEVEDTAVATIRFRSGALATLLVSNSQNPAINARVSVHGSNGASVGVQTDGGAMFVAGMTTIGDAPFNDIWTVPGESESLAAWKGEDAALFDSIDATTHFHRIQIRDFLEAAAVGRQPAVTGEDGRRTVELFTAIYRSNKEGRPVNFPLASD